MTETPRPPATAEFGAVEPGGPALAYPPDGGMALKKFSVGEYDNNVYVIHCTDTNRALIVDGATDAERILREVDGMDVIGIAQTHNHFDHTRALRALVDALAVPVYAHPADEMPVGTVPVADGGTIAVGDVQVRALHTPGHTPGSTSYLAHATLLSGDALFPGGPGNTDKDPARFAAAMASIDRVFSTLPDGTRIAPGHGLDSTIGRERPFVETWRARGW